MPLRRAITLALSLLCLFAAGSPLRAERIEIRRPTPAEPWSDSIQEDLEQTEYHFSGNGSQGFSAPNRAHDLRVRATGCDLHLVSRTRGADPANGGWELRIALQSWGRGEQLHPVAAAAPSADRARVEYRRGPLTEWYLNDERGVEQGFTLQNQPSGPGRTGEVRVVMALSGSLLGYPMGPGTLVFRDGDNRDRLKIDALRVTDANGRELSARFELGVGRLEIVFDDSEAVYPVTVDPTFGTTLYWFLGTQDDTDFAMALGTAGDVNGDGFSDFIVGAPRFDNGQADEGRAFVYLGGPGPPSGNLPPVWSWEPDQANARFGTSVGTAGDVNGDGYDDVIVGAHVWDNDQLEEGAAWIFYGSATGLSPAPGWHVEGNQGGSSFGIAVGTAGDVNADGYADVIIGASLWENDQFAEGRAFVYLGSATGPPLMPSSFVEGNQDAGQLGNAVATAGDVNADGFDDVIVGMIGYGNGLLEQGAARLYLGSAAGLASVPAWTAAGNRIQARYGFSVAGAGDTNGDGYADLIVGAPYWDAAFGPVDEGVAHVYFGNSTGAASVPSWSGRIFQTGGYVGWSVATAGDANGDGYADIVVGSPFLDTGVGADAGRILVYFGGPSGPESSASFYEDGPAVGSQYGRAVATAGDSDGDGLSDVIAGAPEQFWLGSKVGLVRWLEGRTGGPATISVQLSGGQAVARFGQAVSTAGDVNGDGYSDMLVGAYLHDNGQTDEGRAYLYYGAASGISYPSGWIGEIDQAGAQFGHAVGAAGDVNGDGYDDFLVGAYAYDNGQTDEGGAFLYYGSATGPTATPNWSTEGNQAGAWFGFEVASVGDINGDGYADLIFGAPLFDNGQSDEGKVVVYLGSPGGPTGPVWSVEGNQTSAWLGFAAGAAGDVNADGYSDLIVGAPLYDFGGAVDSGLASVYLGGAGGPALKSVWDFGMLQAAAHLGQDVNSAGDFNGDGRSELLIGIPYDDYAGADVGSALLVWGTSQLFAPTYTFMDGSQSGGFFGGRVATGGDVNGDGYSDFLVSAYLYDNGQTDVGRGYLYLGNPAGALSAAATWQPEGNQTDAQLGVSLGSAGDLNGDGFGDVIIGAWLTTIPFVQEGTTNLYLGNEGLGRPRRAQQAQPDGSQLMQRFGLSQGAAAFRARLRGRTAAGRSRVRLQVEARTLSVAFDGNALVSGGLIDTGLPATGGSTVLLDELVGGLAPYTAQRWRARTVSPNPFFPRTPWTFLPDNGAGEADLRTKGCLDLDQDGFGAPGDPSCPGGAATDCAAADATSFPGATEVCDGADNDCDTVVDDVPAPVSASEIEFTPPGLFVYLQWLPDSESTMWDVVRGDLGLLKSGGGDFTTATATCEADNSPFTAIQIIADPPPGQGYWYLMRRVNCGGAGTWDSLAASQVAPRDAEIGSSAGACP